MTTDIASLGMRVDATQVDKGSDSLERFAQSGVKAEGAAAKVEQANAKLAASAQATASHFDTLYDQMERDYVSKYVAGMGRAQVANDNLGKSQRALTQTTLNLTRQFSDVGVSLASGAPIWMVAIQQGSQIQDAFAMAKTQGLGFKEAISGITSGLAKLVGPGAVLAGVAAGVAIFMRQMQQAKQEADNLKSALDGLEKTQQKALGVMGDAASFADKYHVASDGLWKSIEKVIDSQGMANNEVRRSVGATDEAARAARDRAEMERLLTVNILRRASAEAAARAAEQKKVLDKTKQDIAGRVPFSTAGIEDPALAAQLQRQASAEMSKTAGVDAIAKTVKTEQELSAAILAQADALAKAKLIVDVDAKGRQAHTKVVRDQVTALDKLRESSERYLAALAKQVAEEGMTPAQRQQREGDIEFLVAEAAGQHDLALAIQEATAARVKQIEAQATIRDLEAANDLRTKDIASAPDSNPLVEAATIATEKMRTLDSVTQSVAHNMASAFGSVGEALGGLIESQSHYNALQAGLAEELAKVETARRQGKATDEDVTRQVFKNIQVLGQAETDKNVETLKSFESMFDKKSSAYKLLHGLEMAYQAVQVAGHLKEMALDAVHTATSIASSIARGAAKAAEGAATMFAFLGPFAWPAIAAMTATLAAFGLGGLGGGGSAPGVNDAANRQKAQGAGTVLGDASAKSESIANSLAIVAKNTNADLEYSNGMLMALRSIDSNITSLTAALARSLSVGGALDTSGLGLGTIQKGPGAFNKIFNPLSWVFPSWFGTSKTTTLQDQGLQFDPQTLAAVLSGGVAGSSYQQTLTETKKKFFGFTVSDKFNQNTTTSALDQEMAAEFTRIIASLRDGVLAAAGTLGMDGAQAVLDAFQVNIGKISFKDMDAQQIKDTLNAVFSKLGDEMASAVFGGLSMFQKAGEGGFETLLRLAKDYQVVDTALRSLGKTFGSVGVASIEARERLVGLFDSLDDFQSKTRFFAEHFLSDAERLAPIQKSVAQEMARLGYAGVTTREQFKNLVLGLDVSSEAGASLYAALLAVAPAFDKVASAAEDAAKQATQARLTEAANAVSKAHDDLSAAYDAESQALKSTISTFQTFAQSLAAFDAQLGASVASGAKGQYFAARAKFMSTADLAKGGDQAALGDLQNVSQAYLTAAKAVAPSAAAYGRDLAAVRRAVQDGQKAAQHQVDVAQAQLDALNAQVSGLLTVNTSVLSVRAAIAALGQARTEQAAAQAAANGTKITSLSDADLARYIADNPDLRKSWDRGGMLHSLGSSFEEAARKHYLATGQFEIAAGIRRFATGGSFTVAGPSSGDRVPVSFMANGGETVNVSRRDSMERVAQALERQNALLERQNQLLASTAKDTSATQNLLRRVTRDGDSLLTTAA